MRLLDDGRIAWKRLPKYKDPFSALMESPKTFDQEMVKQSDVKKKEKE